MSSAASSPLRSDRLADFRTDRRMLLLGGLAIAIGAIGAVVAYLLLRLIALITNLAFYQEWSVLPREPVDHQLGWLVMGVPVVGAVIIGLMARYGSEKIRGHGIPEALEAILLGRSLVSPKVAILKPISSAVAIGTGGPFGAEGPIIMTGGAFGSLFAQLFHITAAERKTLLVAGAAAGMAAVFATPVAAILLAVELLLFEWKPRSFVPVAIAAIVGSMVRVPLLGDAPVFVTHTHPAPDAPLLGAALLVGVVAGLGSGLLTRLLYAVEDAFARLPLHWMWWPAVGALVLGVGGLIDPRVLGVGYGLIEQLLNGEVLGWALVGLFAAKAIVWLIALGSGTSGGVLAPLLILGGALGATMGPMLPSHDAGMAAMIGMAAMMAGTMRAPLTGMVFLAELTHDYQVLPVLLVGSLGAYAVTVLLMRRSILTEKLARRGQHIAREYSVDLLEMLRVADAMDRTPPTIPASMRVDELAAAIVRADPVICRRQAHVLVDEGDQLQGIVTRGDVLRATMSAGANDRPVRDIASTDVVVTHPDETLQSALTTLLGRDVGRLVVVERADPRRVVGYLGRGDVLAAQRRRHDEEQRRERGLRGWFRRQSTEPSPSLES